MSIRRATLPGGVANRIESLLSARLFVEPQLQGDTVVFISNLSGQLSHRGVGHADGPDREL